MEKIKVSELEGAELDYWVAKAEQRDVCPREHIGSFLHPEYCFTHSKAICERYSRDWSQGGPIIERERICVSGPGPMGGPNPEYYWTAFIDTGSYAGGGHTGNGRTPLIAAMRCFVASKFGEEINVDTV